MNSSIKIKYSLPSVDTIFKEIKFESFTYHKKKTNK
jgi:hypothetical protein